MSGNRFEALDALRGGAALFVVVWHWQLFYDLRSPSFDRSQQPLYSILQPAYWHGPLAVDLFFCLSGFVFHWLYAEKIRQGQISAGEFFLRRFSRLYPLHLATLIGVALAFAVFGPIFYEHDAYHFMLSVLLLSSVGLQNGYSFNGPSWSISIESVLYTLFFIACRTMRSSGLVCALGILAGLELWLVNSQLARGLVSFFAGGAAFLAYRALPAKGRLPLALGCALCWLVTFAQAYLGPRTLPQAVTKAGSVLLLFPLTVIAFALWQPASASARRICRFLGDVSYSVYLLHFPLQVLFAQLTLPFNSAWVMVLFFALLLSIASGSHYYFEVPVQDWIRARLKRPLAAKIGRAAIASADHSSG